MKSRKSGVLLILVICIPIFLTGCISGKTVSIHSNAITGFSPQQVSPQIDDTACVHNKSAVIGNVFIGKDVLVSPFASVRGDEGQPIFIGDESNVQDGVVVHGLETEEHGNPIKANRVTNSETNNEYSVYIGKRVSLAHQAHIHGPAYIGDDTFIGMKAFVFKASIGKNCVVEPGAIVMGVRIPDKRYVPAGATAKTQKQANRLRRITSRYPLKGLNEKVVHVNTSLAKGYNKIKGICAKCQ